jgi:hypothetical protein
MTGTMMPTTRWKASLAGKTVPFTTARCCRNRGSTMTIALHVDIEGIQPRPPNTRACRAVALAKYHRAVVATFAIRTRRCLSTNAPLRLL